jgi:hypothetical protein
MKDFFLLKLLDKFASAFNKFGINYNQIRMILKVKLTLDSRNIPTIMGNKNRKDSDNLGVWSMVIYLFMGFMISIFAWIPFPLFYKMNIIFGMIIFMVLATMISDFSTVLLDVKDKFILLPRPVSNKTIKMAKTIHVSYYLMRITLALSGPSLLMCLIHYGPIFFLVMLLEMILLCGLVMFFTSLLYFAILSAFDGEKLKDIINYFQIGLTVFMTVAYQLIGRMFNISQLNITYTPKWWNFLLPTTWFSAPLIIVQNNSNSLFYYASTAIAVIVPIICFIIYTKVIVPNFEEKLQKLNENGGGKHRLKAFSINKAIAALACSGKEERAFFTFAQNMIASERKLKLQLYPSLAFSVVLPLIMIFNVGSHQSIAKTFNALQTSNSYLNIYWGIAMVSVSVYYISNSEKYRGAWIYRTLPIENPGIVFKGAFKAFMFKFNIPLMALLALVFIPLFGARIIPDIILIFINMFLLAMAFYRTSSKQLPFSKDFQAAKSGGTRVGIMFLLFAICGAMAGIHFALIHVPFGVTINIAISLLITCLIWHFSFRVSWKDVEMSY